MPIPSLCSTPWSAANAISSDSSSLVIGGLGRDRNVSFAANGGSMAMRSMHSLLIDFRNSRLSITAKVRFGRFNADMLIQMLSSLQFYARSLPQDGRAQRFGNRLDEPDLCVLATQLDRR